MATTLFLSVLHSHGLDNGLKYLRARYQRLILGFVFFILLLSILLFLRSDSSAHLKDTVSSLVPGSSPHVLPNCATSDTKELITAEDVVRWLYEPLKLAPDAHTFTDPSDGEVHSLDKAYWKTPLKNRICFIDIDTRPFDGDHELFGNTAFNFKDMQPYPTGMMGHYAYAMIHGYDYKYIRTNNMDDRAPYWTKPPALASILPDYDFVIGIDADAQIHYPEIPFEWLLNRWKVIPGKTAITISREPGNPRDFDVNGRLMDNGGFVVAQNIPRTYEMLRAWTECPDEPSPHYKDCGRWKRPFPAEQAAFSEYISTAFNDTHDINEIDCDDANGSWGFKASEDFPVFCKGRFISHHTLTKGLLKDTIAQTWAGSVLYRVHSQFVKEKNKLVIHRDTNKWPTIPTELMQGASSDNSHSSETDEELQKELEAAEISR